MESAEVQHMMPRGDDLDTLTTFGRYVLRPQRLCFMSVTRTGQEIPARRDSDPTTWLSNASW